MTERLEMLQEYGRFYGEQHFAVAFTAGIAGNDAKRVVTKDWDKTAVLPDGDFAAGMIATRGTKRNPAIVVRASGLIVLECDTEADLARISQLNLPETLTVRSSQTYKRHFYFRPDPALEILPYVAFRFESGKLTADSGRYFVAPPALHPSGAMYDFLDNHGPADISIATLPETIYRQLASQAQRESSELREQIAVDPATKIRAGNRRDFIFRYACMLRRWGLSRPEISAAAHQFNEQRCDPPVERMLVEIQVDGAMKKQGDQELAAAATTGNGTHPDVVEDAWWPVNLATLPDKPPVQPTLGSIGIVYPAKRHVFSGPQESAKTLAAYVLALQVVRDGGNVILIDFEMGAWDARNRLRDFGATDQDLELIHYIEPYEPATDATMPRLLALRPELVVIDAAAGAYDLQGLDDNKRADVERFTRLYVKAFWRAGVATVVLDHVVKNTEARGKYAVGSERKVGGADVHLGFEVVTPISRGGQGHYKILTHKDRGGFLKRGVLAHFKLDSEPDTHHFSWAFEPAEETDTSQPFRPTKLMEKVSIFLELQPDKTASRNQIEDDVTGKRDFIRAAIDTLVREQSATESSGPRGARMVTIVTPYRQNTDLAPPRPDLAPGELNPPRPTSPPSYRGASVEEGDVGDVTSPRQERPKTSSFWGDDD